MSRCRLSYFDSSDLTKPAVVLLHGFLGAAADWQEVSSALVADFRTITIDLPGHGASSQLPEECFTMEACAQEIVALLDDLSLEQVALVGYSMGGRLALYLAIQFPDRFSQLVLESTSPGLRTEQERADRRELDESRARKLEKEPISDFLRYWYSQPLFSSIKRDPELHEQLISLRSVGDPVGLVKSLRFMGTGNMPSLWESLGTLTIPVLCMAGELDPKFAALAREMAVALPHSHSEIIPDAGHILHFEQPDLYISRVRSFLAA